MSPLFVCGVLLAALAGPSQAQPRPDPADPKAAVPELRPRSALAGYRRLSDDPPADWRAANDTVTRIGGWRSYLREAQAPEPKASEVKR
jgi:hypothetical protein